METRVTTMHEQFAFDYCYYTEQEMIIQTQLYPL